MLLQILSAMCIIFSFEISVVFSLPEISLNLINERNNPTILALKI